MKSIVKKNKGGFNRALKLCLTRKSFFIQQNILSTEVALDTEPMMVILEVEKASDKS